MCLHLGKCVARLIHCLNRYPNSLGVVAQAERSEGGAAALRFTLRTHNG